MIPIIITILIIIFGVWLLISQQKKNNINNSTVLRDEAIKILNQWEIEEVFQSHSLNVVLKYKNWAEISTKEPNIDNIFDEVRKCGNMCKDIILATE